MAVITGAKQTVPQPCRRLGASLQYAITFPSTSKQWNDRVKSLGLRSNRKANATGGGSGLRIRTSIYLFICAALSQVRSARKIKGQHFTDTSFLTKRRIWPIQKRTPPQRFMSERPARSLSERGSSADSRPYYSRIETITMAKQDVLILTGERRKSERRGIVTPKKQRRHPSTLKDKKMRKIKSRKKRKRLVSHLG